MNVSKTYVAAAVLFLILVGIGYAAIPPPPVEQNLGFTKDTKFDQLGSSPTNPNQTLCRQCHGAGLQTRHHDLAGVDQKINPVTGAVYVCKDCHPTISGPNGIVVVRERECLRCHQGLNWSRVDPTNASKANVNMSRPHHINTAAAQARHCNDCHGSVIADYDDGHYLPDYDISPITPSTDYKIYNATSGRYWGGCFACHQNTTSTSPALYNQHDTHHAAINGNRSGLDHQKDRTAGMTCNWCHVANTTSGSPIQPVELRNWTLMGSGDYINGTGCEQCHDIGTIHNIQYNYPATEGTKGYGHIGDNWDCNGCHAYWDAGELSGFENTFVPKVDSMTTNPATVNTGVSFDLTLNGNGFLSATGVTSVTAVVSVDGVEYTGTATDTSITVTVPGLARGDHTVQLVKKGDYAWQTKTGGLLSVTVSDPVDATSATLVKTKRGGHTTYTVTVNGNGFGTQPPAEFTEFGVTVTKQGHVYPMTVSSWTNTQIVGTVESAASGNPVTVNALYGSDTVNIS